MLRTHDAPRWAFLAWALLALAGASGCAGNRLEQRTQRIHVETSPPGATVWLQDATGQHPLGTSPLDVEQAYEVEIYQFNPWWWLGVGLSAGALAGGAAWWPSIPGSDDTAEGLSIALMTLGSAALLILLPATIAGQVLDGDELPAREREVTLGAHLVGHDAASMTIKVPSPQPTLNLLLHERPAAAPVVLSALPAPEAAGPAPVAAVFDLKAPKGLLADADAEQLSAHLATRLTQLGKARVVPREQLRARLQQEKTGTFRACFDETCQLELGKALAAEKVVSATLLRVGQRCVVAVNMYDLATEAAERGASIETECRLEELLTAIGQAAEKL